MTVNAQRRPVTPIPRQPIAPMPLWERGALFREPTYLDGQPYTNDHDDEEAEAA